MMFICVNVYDSIYLYSIVSCFDWFSVFCLCLQVLFERVKFEKERREPYKGDKRKAKEQVGPLIPLSYLSSIEKG